MDVCHIIAESLGGANHPHNYILLSSSFNRSVGNRLDDMTCYLAGVEKTRKAIAVSVLMGNTKGGGRGSRVTPLYLASDTPTREQPVHLWKRFRIRDGKSAEELAGRKFEKGKKFFDDI